MTKLKTLKDLEKEFNESCSGHWKQTGKDEIVQMIKEEAIKWVYAFEKANRKPPFKDFFNITEDDLK